MPHTESAKKRHRQSLERRSRNRDRTTELKTLAKKLLRSVHDGKPDEAKDLYRELTKRLDQAAVKKVIHPHKAARVKARLAKRLLQPAKPAQAAKPAPKATKA